MFRTHQPIQFWFVSAMLIVPLVMAIMVISYCVILWTNDPYQAVDLWIIMALLWSAILLTYAYILASYAIRQFKFDIRKKRIKSLRPEITWDYLRTVVKATFIDSDQAQIWLARIENGEKKRQFPTELFLCGLDLEVQYQITKKQMKILNSEEMKYLQRQALNVERGTWCMKYGHWVDYKLVHEICEDPHPKGCANCEHVGENEIVNEKEMAGMPRHIKKQ